MVNYKNGKIYKIVCDVTKKTYYGSTTQPLCKRLAEHKKPSNLCKTKEMVNPKIYLIEDFPCERREHLHARERYYIENNECINRFVPTRTGKEWREGNKEEKKKYDKEYYNKNKEKIKKKDKEYYEKNKEKIKEYYETNKERIAERSKEKKKEYYETNKEKIKEYYETNKEKFKNLNKQYYETNKEKIKEYYTQLPIINCDCGGRYQNILYRKKRHEKTKKHQKFIS